MFLKRLVSNLIPSSSFSSSSSSPRVLKIGDVLKKSRKFSDLDVLGFSKLSQDSNPVHFDSNYAKEAGFEDRIVHGMLVATLFPQIIASHFPGAVYISQSLQFKLPVYIDEEIVAQVQALNLRDNKKRYITKFSTKCFKNGEVLVLEGEAVALLPTLSIDEEDTSSLTRCFYPASSLVLGKKKKIIYAKDAWNIDLCERLKASAMHLGKDLAAIHHSSDKSDRC